MTTIRLGAKSTTLGLDSKFRVSSRSFAGGNIVSLERVSWDPVAEFESNQSSIKDYNRKMELDIIGRLRSQFTDPIPVESGNFFGYDRIGRLVADTFATVESDLCDWDEEDGWVCPDPVVDSVQTHWYDAVGNRDSTRYGGGGVVTGTYQTGNRMASFAGCTYQHDDDGNITLRDCPSEDVRFHWSTDGLLKAFKVVGGDSLQFYYDANGRLVRRDLNGQLNRYFLWHGDHLIAELSTNGSVLMEYSYYPGMDRLHAVVVGDSVYFAQPDGIGNVIGLVSEKKRKSATYKYDRWGQVVWSTELLVASVPNRARFKGALWMGDEGVDLYFMRARWYEPRSGRLVTEDPIGLEGDVNTYLFAGANPVSGSDPSGLCGEAPLVLDAVGGSCRPDIQFGGSLTLGLLAGGGRLGIAIAPRGCALVDLNGAMMVNPLFMRVLCGPASELASPIRFTGRRAGSRTWLENWRVDGSANSLHLYTTIPIHGAPGTGPYVTGGAAADIYAPGLQNWHLAYFLHTYVSENWSGYAFEIGWYAHSEGSGWVHFGMGRHDRFIKYRSVSSDRWMTMRHPDWTWPSYNP